METSNLDFNRIISTNEILDIDEEKYNNIIKHVNIKKSGISYHRDLKQNLIYCLNDKEKELIIAHYLIANTNTFIEVLEKSILISNYSNIEEFYNEINYLCELKESDYKKFKFLLPRLNLEEKLTPIIKTFIRVYKINNINVIINKLNCLVAKDEYSFESSIQKIKK